MPVTGIAAMTTRTSQQLRGLFSFAMMSVPVLTAVLLICPLTSDMVVLVIMLLLLLFRYCFRYQYAAMTKFPLLVLAQKIAKQCMTACIFRKSRGRRRP